MKIRFYFILFTALFFCSVLSAQDVDLGKGFHKDKKGQDAFFRAEDYFDNGYYLLALPLYRSLEPTYGTSDYLIYRIGICLLYKSDETQTALDYLKKVKEKNPKAADIDLYLAKAYHLNGDFDQAIAQLDLYEKQKNLPPSKRDQAEQLRKYCMNAKELSSHPVEAKITNVGEPVNTENSEYVPVVSSDDSIMLFTYRGEHSTGGLQSYPGTPDSSGIYFEDVFYTYRQGGKWQEPVALDSTINGDGHDACIGISNDGQVLLIYKDEAGGGDIYQSRLTGFYWTAPVPLLGDINSTSWEGSATFSSDMKTIFFASERPGGYGGRDIYQATLMPDGTWGNVRNLGPKVNTAMNEDAPFLHPNGTTLIFSSESFNSMGGYDIFKTEMTVIDSTNWEPGDAENIGYPINTPGDDKYFVLGTDGKHGYYSSGKSGGQGQQDIYLVEADFGLKNANVLQVSGIVTLNDKPDYALVSVKDDQGKLRTFEVSANATNGKYLVNLPAGRKYTLTFVNDSAGSQQHSVDATGATEEMQRMTLDVSFYTGDYATRIHARQDSARMADSLALAARMAMKDSVAKPVVNPDASSGMAYDEMLRVYGNVKVPGMIYRVQIAAYNFPSNYNSGPLRALGPIDQVKLDDGITRFTMGQFETLAEADAYCKKVIAAGQTDAFVTAQKDGKRYLLKDLAALHFFQK